MTRFLLGRLVSTVPVLLVVALVVFLLARLTPGDPAALLAGEFASPEQIAAIRAQLGLDQPLPAQFLIWIANILRGDLGISIFSGKPVAELVLQRLEPTLLLALTTITLTTLIAVPLGVASARRYGTAVDRFTMVLAVLGFSVPVFVLGYTLIWLFSLGLGWLPVQGFVSPRDGVLPFLRSITLPTLALTFVYTALVARTTRASMLEVLGEDYIRTARSKGQRETVILFRDALRVATVPIVTVIAMGFALLVGGVVVTETVFNIPGLGRLVVDAILKRDYPLIQGLILFFSTVYIALNFLVDVVYTLIDPRIRL